MTLVAGSVGDGHVGAEPVAESGNRTEERLPIVPYLTKDDSGRPGFIGTRCDGCATHHLGEIMVCTKCGNRTGLQRISLATTGRLYNYTIVYRSLPDVVTPFVSAIVDLEGGGSVKANLDVPADALAFDMPVRAVFDDLAQADRKGRQYYSFHFVAA